MVRIYNGILLSYKKGHKNAICSNMDGTRESSTGEVSQKEKDKYHMISHISRIYYIAQINLSTDKKLMDLENRLVLPRGRRRE